MEAVEAALVLQQFGSLDWSRFNDGVCVLESFSCNYLTTRGSTKPAQTESIFIQMQLIFPFRARHTLILFEWKLLFMITERSDETVGASP